MHDSIIYNCLFNRGKQTGGFTPYLFVIWEANYKKKPISFCKWSFDLFLSYHYKNINKTGMKQKIQFVNVVSFLLFLNKKYWLYDKETITGQ